MNAFALGVGVGGVGGVQQRLSFIQRVLCSMNTVHYQKRDMMSVAAEERTVG